ncbi:hypothetical protein QQS21_000722 [Conoideocrella luteorostrata]|uniref:FAD-binding PCMH-type domain-containing protein n=1 Tax=Conoideocrella luteorostrata TaxID=1105319 RepID=A0AAJ0CY99_9HYPO|nr:hypothetical protein QQS21_000722 [Conoideocrella luteorostrata]
MYYLWAVAALSAIVNAAVTPDTDTVCTALYSKFPELLVWDPIEPKGVVTLGKAATYTNTLHDYWNSASAGNRPACGFFPANADQVSFAVKVLNAYPAVQFALKGGGHNPNLGFSSVKEGVLIAFRPNSKYAIPSPDGKSIEVGPGCKWEDVYGALDPLGKAVVGGRLGNVGVPGLLLGGGLSYLSAQYGLACDNIISYECVLANGTVVTASETSHPELYFALKGGGNQFAIVTKFVLKTFNIGKNGKIWGGVRTYTEDKSEEILSAITNFVAKNTDPKAAIIPTFDFFSAVGINAPAIVVFYFYDGLQVPAGVFDEFNAVKSLTDDTKVKSYPEMAQEVLGGEYEALRFQIRENTFPNMPPTQMKLFLNDHFNLMKKKSQEAALKDLLDFKLFSFAIQPMPRGIAKASQDAGGDALGLRPENGDRVWIEYDIAWLSPLCDGKCPPYFANVVDQHHDLHKEKYSGIYPTNYESGDLEYLSYNPIFMNDAMEGQDVLRSYGNETYARLLSTHEAYDPHGFFAERQGGFKFT